MKICIIFIVTIAGCISFPRASFGQTQNYDNAAPPVVIPASPTAAALFHDIDVPIDYYTGGQKLSIPIHTVKIGTLQLPISLHYRATGIKVEEDAGWTGLAWDLDAAGAIGRSIIGWPDEDPDIGYRRTAAFLGMPNPNDFNAINAWFTSFSQDACNQYNLSLGKTMEMTPDNYFINLCGNSGRLFFDQNSIPYISPYKPWKISGNEASGFTVVTDDGTTYVLQLIEGSTNTVETLPGDDHSTPVTGNTSWYLTQIISANKTDTINISYKPVGYTVPSYIPTESMSVPWSQQTSPCGQGTPSPSHSWTYVTHSVSGYVLSSIATRNQRVDFISNANRSDIPDSTKGMPYKLDSIMIYAVTPGTPEALLNKFIFNYGYYNKGAATVTQRLRLLSLTQSDAANLFPQRYTFTYHDSTLPAKTSMAQDLWGFYNGKTGNTTMIPTYQDPNGVVTTLADRSIDTTKASLGLLTTVQYPTGGTTSFEYESNRWGQSDSLLVNASQTAHTAFVGYSDPTFDQETFTIPWGQFVTIQTEIHEPDNLIGEGIVKIFAAGSSTPVFSSQTITNLSTTTKYLDAGTYTITAAKGDYETQVSALIIVRWQDLVPAPYVGNPIGGARIKRMVQSDGRTPIIKRFTYLLNDSVSSGKSLGNSVFSSLEYVPMMCAAGGGGSYKAGEWTFYGQHSTAVTAVGGVRGGNVAYTKVTVLNGDNGENGREEYYYNFTPDIGGGGYPYGPPSNFDDVRGQLLKKLVYRSDSTLVQKIENTYSFNTDHGDPNFRSIYGVKAGTLHRSIEFGSGGCPAGSGWGFSSRLYQVNQFWPTLYSTAETMYDLTGNDSLTTVTYFSYDTLNTQVARQAMVSSKSDSVIIYTKYADAIPDNPVATEMTNRNMVSVPLESDKYRNLSFVAKKVTNFSIFSSGGKQMVLPSTVQLQSGSGPLETRLQLNSYDKRGNLLSQNKPNDLRHIYIYDYQDAYPIADITNADTGSVAYTSFEADGLGNWTIGSAGRDTTSAITGSQSYTLNSDISRSGLTSTTTYIVSYWTRNNSPFTITGTISGYPVKGKTISYNSINWTLYTHRVTGQTTVTISGSGPIDELRLYPLGAQMTTYTYTPLVGMTSQTDAGSRITYYEYDGLQRLKRIRDQDHNILKSLEYQYQVSSGCGANCYAITMQTLAGTSTLGYPVGVFDVHGKLLGNATGPAQYVNLWNADTADARIGTLSTGSDSLHFSITLNTGMSLPAGVTGCRYYQLDLAWNYLDGIRNMNAAYVDFGDGTGMHLPTNYSDTSKDMPAGTIYQSEYSHQFGINTLYYKHTYTDTSLKTLTFYHNDGAEDEDLDNGLGGAVSLTYVKNLRGNLPQHTTIFGGSCYQQPTMTSIDSIRNWNTISTIQYFRLNDGDNIHPVMHLGYTQDFMKNNKGLLSIYTIHGYVDSTFTISRLKSDWSTYFTGLQRLEIIDDQWNREDLSTLPQLNWVQIWAANQNHLDDHTGPYITIPSAVVDTIFNQVAAGAGQNVYNGAIDIESGGPNRTSASDAAVSLLKSKGWAVAVKGVLQ